MFIYDRQGRIYTCDCCTNASFKLGSRRKDGKSTVICACCGRYLKLASKSDIERYRNEVKK